MKCLWEVLRHSPTTIQLNEFESIAALCFRALENSNHEVRCSVAHLLGNVAAAALTPKTGPVRTTPSTGSTQPAAKVVSVEEVLGIISTGFLRGGGGFLKGTGEMIKGPAATSREVRVGVTMVNQDHPSEPINYLILPKGFLEGPLIAFNYICIVKTIRYDL